MKLKVTMKVGDETHVLNEAESKRMGSEKGFEQLLEAKGMLTAIFSMMDVAEPDKAGKRIEMIMEFEDDGQYIVIGRKPKEEPEDGR